MEKIITGIPGYRVFEYLLVLSPHAELAEKILKVKEAFADAFKVDGVKGVRQQLALVTFTQYEMMEEKIVNRLKTIAMGYHPFKVELKDFGSYPSHTIYINVTSKVPIQNLVKLLRHEGQRLMKLNEDNKPHFIMEPHLTIARKLKPWQYEKGWLEYSHKSFTGRFIADSMILLRRPAGEVKYQLVQRFEFENLPVSTKQGELFG
ncbi:MAG TPA: 2'-5' RNA ligase family protein [Chitinophagaceae bacterium]